MLKSMEETEVNNKSMKYLPYLYLLANYLFFLILFFVCIYIFFFFKLCVNYLSKVEIVEIKCYIVWKVITLNFYSFVRYYSLSPSRILPSRVTSTNARRHGEIITIPYITALVPVYKLFHLWCLREGVWNFPSHFPHYASKNSVIGGLYLILISWKWGISG